MAIPATGSLPFEHSIHLRKQSPAFHGKHATADGVDAAHGRHYNPHSLSLSTPPPSASHTKPTVWVTKPSPLRIGSHVIVDSVGITGTLKFQGTTHFKAGLWAGIQLDMIGTGKNDGSVNDVRYFTCPDYTGIFVLVSKVSLVSDSPSTSPRGTGTKAPTSLSLSLPSKRIDTISRTGRPSAYSRPLMHSSSLRERPNPQLPHALAAASPMRASLQITPQQQLAVQHMMPRAHSAPLLDLLQADTPSLLQETAMNNRGPVTGRRSSSLAVENVMPSEKENSLAPPRVAACTSCTVLRHDLNNQAALTELSQKRMADMENTIVELRNAGRESLELYQEALTTCRMDNATFTKRLYEEQLKVNQLKIEREDLRKAGLDTIEVYEATLSELSTVTEERQKALAESALENKTLQQENTALTEKINEWQALNSQLQAQVEASLEAQRQAEKKAEEATLALQSLMTRWEQVQLENQQQTKALDQLAAEKKEWKDMQTMPVAADTHTVIENPLRLALQSDIVIRLTEENKRLHKERRSHVNCRCFVSTLTRLQKRGLPSMEEDKEVDMSEAWSADQSMLLRKEETHTKAMRDKQREVLVLQRDIDELEIAIERSAVKEASTLQALDGERQMVYRLQCELRDIKQQVRCLRSTRRMSSKRWTFSKSRDLGFQSHEEKDENYCEICEVSGHDLMTCSVVMQKRPLTPSSTEE
ncbi:hypothetical protein BDF14DRAFT_1886686 [Spinellus fusiger]|nr:hypothetical protein BDF14DRAFT_1886686 [Spinellus fusiger]